jgi:hypothetical protein
LTASSGAAQVLERTLDNCASAGLTHRLLPPWPDVDTGEDLRLRRAQSGPGNTHHESHTPSGSRRKHGSPDPHFLLEQGWVEGSPEVSFLAAGEYNQNFLVRAGGERLVFRINHGSQLGLADQIGYEFKVLRCVAPSGVTPRPLRVHSDPHPFGGGVLLMQYLPGITPGLRA